MIVDEEEHRANNRSRFYRFPGSTAASTEVSSDTAGKAPPTQEEKTNQRQYRPQETQLAQKQPASEVQKSRSSAAINEGVTQNHLSPQLL